MEKVKKKFVNVSYKNVAKVCHQSNYYLRTSSYVACKIVTRILNNISYSMIYVPNQN